MKRLFLAIFLVVCLGFSVSSAGPVFLQIISGGGVVPVTVSIGDVTGADYSGCEDAVIKEFTATTNYGSATDLEVSKWDTDDYSHTLIKFSGLSNLSGKTVTAATLYLYVESAKIAAPPQTHTLRKLLRDWVEGEATWNIYSTGNNWATAGALNNTDRNNSTVTATASVPDSTGWISFTSAQLITDVQAMIDGTNYGWHIERTDGADDLDYIHYTSSDGATAANRPYLSVTVY